MPSEAEQAVACFYHLNRSLSRKPPSPEQLRLNRIVRERCIRDEAIRQARARLEDQAARHLTEREWG